MKIIYSTPEGGVAIVTPVSDKPIETIAAKVVPSGTAYEIVSDSSIPSNSTFRDAWERNGAAIVVNLPKAKAIAQERLEAVAREAIDKSLSDFALGLDPQHEAGPLRVAFQHCKNEITTSGDIASVKTCLENFINNYGVQ